MTKIKALLSIIFVPFAIFSCKKLWELHNYDHDETFGRMLYDSDGTLFLVDSDGNEYEPYSMAWRYLGMYIDCGNNNNNNGYCYRRVLWAAYIDPNYEGGSIGEYQFYDLSTRKWDTSTCKTGRCAKMDCHEPDTHFKLLGVFKENDGLYDFAEQLFKHQGYCLWSENAYEFMSEHRESWPSKCKSVYFYDNNGRYTSAYFHMQPEAFGNFTYGVYEDNKCTKLSSKYDSSTYLRWYYGKNGYNDVEYRQQLMNEYMNEYKICQPCRAYSKYENYNYDDDGGSGSGDHYDEGGGYSEQWGFNCYDDAGYRNCNQCYKFQTKTDMEAADSYDLATASKQGTILEINVNGKIYGSGGFYEIDSSSSNDSSSIYFLYCSMFVTCVLAVLVWKTNSFILIYNLFTGQMPKSFKEEFMSSDASTDTDDSSSQESNSMGAMNDPPPVENWIILRSRVGRDGNVVSSTNGYVIKAANNDEADDNKKKNKPEKKSTYLAPVRPANEIAQNNDKLEETFDCNQCTNNESVYLVPITSIENKPMQNNDNGKVCVRKVYHQASISPVKNVSDGVLRKDDAPVDGQTDNKKDVEICNQNHSVSIPTTADEAIRSLQMHFERVNSELDGELSTI